VADSVSATLTVPSTRSRPKPARRADHIPLQSRPRDRYHVGGAVAEADSPTMAPDFPTEPGQNCPPPLAPEATVTLLARVREGDRVALDALFERCVPALRRWAHGRLPASARGMQDTADLVQDTVLATLRRLEKFEARHQGALQAFLRKAVMNRIRDIIRQRNRRGTPIELPEDLIDEQTSPLEKAIGAENLARYEAALERLRPDDQEAIVSRLELQYSYEELVLVLGKPTADAARVAVMRAMKRLVEEIRDAR
jgi:RNA polymerase sigma-70 factor (ECF subfamily)